MIIDDERSKLPGARVELFASDLSEGRLEKAQSGLYSSFEVQRGLPVRLLVRHFQKTDEMWALSPRIRQMVRWRRINLLADLRPLGQFDVIFCRNVVRDFDATTHRLVLEQLARALPDDGYLILGLDESVGEATETLKPIAGRPGVYIPDLRFRRAA
jgi:chemotaxis protein methyltransferase CheR